MKISRTLWWALLATAMAMLTGCVPLGEIVPGRGAEAADADRITASGFIEGEEVIVAPETGGRIAALPVDRGDEVSAGEVIVRLDDDALRSRRAEAEAAVAAAEANLALVLAGTRAEELAAARAELSEAEAQHTGAVQAVLDAREAITNPQELESRIHDARSRVVLAEQNVELAEADLAEMELKRDVYAERGGDIERVWDLQVQGARAALEEAQANLSGARATLGALLAVRDTPLQIEAELHRAESEVQMAAAEIEAARARLDQLAAGPTEGEIALARAQVQQAQAALRIIDAQIAQLTLIAPMDGLVNDRVAQVGETVTPGRPLLTIANLDEVKLVIYVPQDRIGQIQVGQTVSVTVDSFPDLVFEGRVSGIAGEAEFTPGNVQTEEKRVNLVFAVDVAIPNPDRALKLGMPADAVIRP
jgi:multidrug resistance efflux pump